MPNRRAVRGAENFEIQQSKFREDSKDEKRTSASTRTRRRNKGPRRILDGASRFRYKLTRNPSKRSKTNTNENQVPARNRSLFLREAFPCAVLLDRLVHHRWGRRDEHGRCFIGERHHRPAGCP